MELRPRKKNLSAYKELASEVSPITASPAALKRRGFSIGAMARFLSALVRYTMIGALALLCAGVFFVAVIMGEAPELGAGEKEQATGLAAPAPLPGSGEFASQEISVLASYFPAAMAQLSSGSGLALQQGTVQDVVVEGQACRVVSLRYQIGQDALTLRSATPAAYLQQYGAADMVLSPDAVMLGALPGVSMRTASQQVMLARQGELLYVLEAPVGFAGLEQLSAWVVLE